MAIAHIRKGRINIFTPKLLLGKAHTNTTIAIMAITIFLIITILSSCFFTISLPYFILYNNGELM